MLFDKKNTNFKLVNYKMYQVMKKILLLCMVFVFSNSFFAQETETKAKKAKTEKVSKAKEKADAKKEALKKEKAEAKKAATKEKADAKKAEAKAKKEAATAGKEAKKAATELKTKVEAKEEKAAKPAKEAKEAKEKATKKVAKKERVSTEKANPNTTDKVTGEYNGKKVFTGPRGGRYYINKNGNKTYIDDDQGN